MPKSTNISRLFSFDTEYNADSVEWCPHKPNQNVFVCASYYLIENEISNDGPRKRGGRILLFSITPEAGLLLHQTVNTAAVLDQKWNYNKIDGFSILGVVNALKKIEIYKLNNDMQIQLVSSFELQDNESETLILSLDWSTGIYKSDEPEIVCSDSKGNVHLIKLVCNNLILLNSWHGHNFEAWISVFYYWDTNVFFSGLLMENDPVIIQDPSSSSQCAPTSVSSEVQQEHQLRDTREEELITDIMTLYDPDPAKWVLTAHLIDYIAQNGAAQNLELDFKLTKRVFGNKTRFLNKNNFIRKMANGEVKPRKWLIYSESTKKVFCGPCRLFSADATFAKEGVDDWKNLKKLLMIHENSTNHKSNLLLIKVRGSKLGRIDTGLTEAVEEEMSYWQNVLQRVVVVVKALASRGLPFRGTDEVFGSLHNGNFMMLLELISEFDLFLAQHIEKYGNPGKGKVSYLSSTVCNEFIQIMSNTVLSEIVRELQSQKYFSLIVDSTPDMAHIDQLSLVARYVLKNGDPVERFLMFLSNVGHKSEDLFNCVTDQLKELKINIQDCRGQSYDNASNMSGIYSGLQARIKEVNANALYVPYAGHSLNLVGTTSAECCLEAVSFFGLLQEIYKFFSVSTGRWELLNKSQAQTQTGDSNDKTITLKSLSVTRWSARGDACIALKRNWSAVNNAFFEIQNDPNQKAATRVEASTLRTKLECLETEILLEVWGTVLKRVNYVSTHLQKVDLDLAEAVNLLKSLVSFFKEIRKDFDGYEKKGMELCGLTYYKTKRKQIRKLKIDEIRDNEEIYFNDCDKFRIDTFYAIIDKLIAEMDRRCQAYIGTLEKFDVLFHLNDINVTELKEKGLTISKAFCHDIEIDIIEELVHLQCHLKSLNLGNNRVAENPRTLLKWLKEKELQDIYPNVEILLRIFNTLPISNTSAERSFSVLKRIKNLYRTSMIQERVSGLALLCIEGEFTKKISFEETIKSFAFAKSRKKHF